MESKLSQKFVFGRGLGGCSKVVGLVIVHQPSHHSAPVAPKGGVEDSILGPLIMMMTACAEYEIHYITVLSQSLRHSTSCCFGHLAFPSRSSLKYLIPGVLIDFDSLRQNVVYAPKRRASIPDIGTQDLVYGNK